MFIRRALFLAIGAAMVFFPAGAGLAAGSQRTAANPLESAAPNSITPVGYGFKVANEAYQNEIYPAVVYNSTRSEYLVVWYDDLAANDDICAQRLKRDGSLNGAPFYIVTGGTGIDRRYPRVAYNSRADQYLVVWEQQDSNGTSIHGRRVSGSGLILDSNDIVIEAANGNTTTPATPVVAYAYTPDKYLVVWSETWHLGTLPTSIYGQVVLGSGVVSGSTIHISDDPGGVPRTLPDLVYNILKNEYMVVWQQLDPADPSPISDILARRVTGDGGLPTSGPIVIAAYTKSSTSPAVATLPIQPNGQYLVVWESVYNPNDRDILGRLVSWDGSYNSQVDIPISVTNIVDELQPNVAGSTARGQYLVTWRQQTLGPFALTGGRLVTPSGSMANDPFNLGGLVASHSRTAAGWLGSFLTVYDDIPLTPDFGVYGVLAGNQLYLPHIKK